MNMACVYSAEANKSKEVKSKHISYILRTVDNPYNCPVLQTVLNGLSAA